MRTRFKCRCCRRVLASSYDQDPDHGELLFRLWYVDDSGLKHFAVTCLHCGTIHDGFATSLRSIFTLMRRPIKVINDINPLEIAEGLLSRKSPDDSIDCREVLMSELRLPEEVIDVLVHRGLLGPAFGRPRSE